MSSNHPPLNGRRLGEFELREQIAEGGFGAIYLAEQVGLERQAVVKTLRSRFDTDETAQLRFLREARLASTLDHPYAAHVYAFGAEPDGVMWIAMELVRGTTLATSLRTGPMPLRVFVPLLDRLCEVIATAHEHGIVHRDIKPQNVMVIRRAGALLPKLLDLGIAKYEGASAAAAGGTAGVEEGSLLRVKAHVARLEVQAVETVAEGGGRGRILEQAPSWTSEEESQSLTGADDLMGSPGYMAPEQWTRADLADARSDIYALGVLAYEAVVGERPFNGNPADLARQHMTAPVPSLPGSLPRDLYAVIARAMAKEPSHRYATALELSRDFRRAANMGDGEMDLPTLARDVTDLTLRDYPQPLAESVADLDGARGAHAALEAASRVARVAVRILAVGALAAHAQDGDPFPAEAVELLLQLRKRRLGDEEWLALARASVTRDEDHPLPALARFLREDAGLEALLQRHEERAVGTLLTAQQAAEELGTVLTMTATVLRSLSFLAEYSVGVVGEGGMCDLWTGVRRKRRVTRPASAGAGLEPGEAVLLGEGVAVVSLAPFAVVARPSPNLEPELFLVEGHGRAGVQLVALPGGFEQTSDAMLAWLDRLGADVHESSFRMPVLESPYRGLAPLTAADANAFFGREREVESFLNRLRSESLLVVVGPSGAGKSSFVQAGVAPQLGSHFHPIVFRPGRTPLAALQAKLGSIGVATDDLSLERHAGEVAGRVRTRAHALGTVLLFVVDQFEETFTVGAASREERATFCAWLTAIASGASDPARVVLTLRDDFLSKVKEDGSLGDRLEPALALLGTPGPAELQRILVEPARRASFAFESKALVDEMVEAVRGQPGALALLSFAASKLWDSRDEQTHTLGAAAYHAMGGVAGALAQHGEEVLARMPSEQRALVRQAFRRLVTAEGTRAATRRDELLAVLGGNDAARTVVERLVAARLLVVAEREDGATYVEVIHEALLGAWPRIAQWQREDADGNRVRDQIRAAAKAWEERGRPRGLLWRDELLDDFRRFRVQHSSDLTASEDAFGKASLAERGRGRRLRMGVVALLAAAAVGTSYIAWQQTLARRAAQAATAQAQQANHHAEESASRARDAARLAAAHLHAEDPTLQLALLRDIEATPPLPAWAPEARRALHGGVAAFVWEGGVAVHALKYAPSGELFATGSEDGVVRLFRPDGSTDPVFLRGHTSSVSGLSFSPDGHRLASSSDDKTVRIWDLAGGKPPVVLTGHGGGVQSVAFSPDGSRVVSGAADGVVRIFRADGSGDPIVLRGHTEPVVSVAFSPDGLRVVSGSRDKTVRVWNADGSGEPLVFRGHIDVVANVAFDPSGRQVASTSDDATLRLWPLDGHRPVVLHGHTDRIDQLAFSPDGKRIATASHDDTIRIWNADASLEGETCPRAPCKGTGSGDAVVLRGHTGYVGSIAFSPDSLHLVSGATDKTVRVWNVDGTGEPRVFSGHIDDLSGVAFAPDGKSVASGDFAGSVRVWRLDAPDPRVIHGHTLGIEGVAVSTDGRIASASDDETVRLFDLYDGRPLAVLRGHTGNVYYVAFSPDAKRLASASQDKTVRVWNVEGSVAPVPLLVLRGHTSDVYDVSFSPDGKRIASASNDKTVRVWNSDGSGEPLVLRGHDDRVYSVAFSPDGERLVTASRDKTVRVWNADGTGQPLVLRGHTETVLFAAFSPDGKRIASASFDQTIRIWNADGSGEPLVLRGSGGSIYSLSFSPDGRRLASTSTDKSIRIWNTDGGAEPTILYGHTEAVSAVVFTPDGRHLVSGGDDLTLRVWTDFAPIAADDPRLWTATNDCLSPALEGQLLGVDEDVAKALEAKCQARVAAARGR